jgi:sortase A
MKTGYPKLVSRVEHAALVLGIAFCTVFLLAHLHRVLMVRAAVSQFEESKAGAAGSVEENQNLSLAEPSEIANATNGAVRLRQADYSLWSSGRIKAYLDSLGGDVEPPLAMLRIPKIRLEVPVLNGTDELTLNRGVGRIAGTAVPGQSGNVGIAGHRDGFFRGLKSIIPGDLIELSTNHTNAVYRVQRVRITSPNDTSVLQSGPEPSLTLITCYPFYFVGPAPKRYIVEATLRR